MPVVAQADALTSEQPLTTEQITEAAELFLAEQLVTAQQLLEIAPNDFDAIRIMGFVHSSHGQQEKMYQCWLRCKELQPNRTDVTDQLARYLYQIEEYEQAIEYWQNVIKIDEKYPGVHQRIGDAYSKLGRHDEAIAAFRRALDEDPKDFQAHYLLGEVKFQAGELAAAKQHYQQAVAINPEFGSAYYGLIKTCARLGQQDELAGYTEKFQAIQAAQAEYDQEYRKQYDDFQKLRAKVSATCYDSALVYLRLKKPKTALKLLERAAEIDPEHVPSRRALVATYKKAGRLDAAMARYRELARISPENSEYHLQIGNLAAKAGSFKQAEVAFIKAVRAAPKSGSVLRALAKFYLNTNQQLARAAELAKQAVKVEPIAESHFVLGWAYAKVGKLDAAEKTLQVAIKMAPTNQTYRQLLSVIRKAR